MLSISELFIYPVKGLGGISVLEAELPDRGLKYDRRWMLVDENNHFISQRQITKLGLLKTEVRDEGVSVRNRGNGDAYVIPFLPSDQSIVKVIVWEDECLAHKVGKEADEWF